MFSAQAHSGHVNLIDLVELSMLTLETCPKNFRLMSQGLIILQISLENTGLQNTEQAVKCKEGHETLQNLVVDVISSISYSGQYN